MKRIIILIFILSMVSFDNNACQKATPTKVVLRNKTGLDGEVLLARWSNARAFCIPKYTKKINIQNDKEVEQGISFKYKSLYFVCEKYRSENIKKVDLKEGDIITFLGKDRHEITNKSKESEQKKESSGK